MSPEEFAEYKFVIQDSLDLVKFNDRVDIIKVDDSIYIASQRDFNIAVLISPRGSEFTITYFDNGAISKLDVLNLAVPDSVQTLGELLRNHLKAKYGRPQDKADLGQPV